MAVCIVEVLWAGNSSVTGDLESWLVLNALPHLPMYLVESPPFVACDTALLSTFLNDS